MLIEPTDILQKCFSGLTWNNTNNRNEIYLTFDDGPAPSVTPWVLDTLNTYKAKATFFCLGKNVHLYPEIHLRILREGHRTGNHSYSHLKGWISSTDDYLEDVEKADRLIQSPLFRPPYGKITIAQIKQLRKNFRIIMWSLLTRDYDRKTAGDIIFQNIQKKLIPGTILVFHDSCQAEKNLRHVLPRTLELIQSRNFVPAIL